MDKGQTAYVEHRAEIIANGSDSESASRELQGVLNIPTGTHTETLPPQTAVVVSTTPEGLVQLLIRRPEVDEVGITKQIQKDRAGGPMVVSEYMPEAGPLHTVRRVAKEAGKQFYMSDKACGVGHVSVPRYVSNSQCVLCARLTQIASRGGWKDNWPNHVRFVEAAKNSAKHCDTKRLADTLQLAYDGAQNFEVEPDPLDTFAAMGLMNGPWWKATVAVYQS